MKIIFIFLLSLSLTINTFSQKVSISPPVNIRNDNSFEVISINNIPIVFRYNNNDFILNIFDQNLSGYSEKKIFLEKEIQKLFPQVLMIRIL